MFLNLNYPKWTREAGIGFGWTMWNNKVKRFENRIYSKKMFKWCDPWCIYFAGLTGNPIKLLLKNIFEPA